MTNSDRLQEIRERTEKATSKLEATEIHSLEDLQMMLDDPDQASGAWWVKSPEWIDCEDDGLYFTQSEATFYENAKPDIDYLLQLVTEQQREIDRLKNPRKLKIESEQNPLEVLERTIEAKGYRKQERPM